MARLGEYKQVVEGKQLIEEAMLLLEEQNINFWKEGLKIGNDLLGLSFQIPKGGPRQIERLHYDEIGRFLKSLILEIGKVEPDSTTKRRRKHSL